MKQPSLGVDFSNDYVAELQALNIPGEEVERRVTARENELPNEIELSYGLFSYDLESGNLLWATRFHEGRPPVGRHRKNSYTSETPVTDGRAIYVYVAFQGLYAFDFDGNQLWAKRLSPHQVYLDFGAGSSPALHGSKLFILNDNEEQSFIAAYDKNTGKQLWYTPRRGLGSGMGRKSGWSTPFVWEIGTAGVLSKAPGVSHHACTPALSTAGRSRPDSTLSEPPPRRKRSRRRC